MDAHNDRVARLFLENAQTHFHRYLPRIVRCLRSLSEKEIWWRPNPASNSAGNLVLHLCGNMRQWIVSGLGGATDIRVREKEFSERGPIPRAALVAQLQKTVRESCVVLRRFPPEALLRPYMIQGFHTNGLAAVAQVYEHFSHHAGQIIYIAKMKRGKDMRFTKLPALKKHGRSQNRGGTERPGI